MKNRGRGLFVVVSLSLSAGLVHCSSDDPAGTPGADAGTGSDATTGGDSSTGDAFVPGTDGAVDAAVVAAVDAPADAAPGSPITVTAFDEYATFGANYLSCDRAGACYGNRGSIYKLAANATAYTVVGSSANGLVTATPSSILLDSAGNVYTNAGCGGSLGVYKLPSGGNTWAKIGTGLTDPNPTSCTFNTMAVDSAGTLYIGFAINPKELWKLPAGATEWTNTGTGLNDTVRSTKTIGNDVYVALNGGLKKLAAGATAWADYGDQDSAPILPYHLNVDAAGNLYVTNESSVFKLPAGATTATAWQVTTGFTTGSYASNPVFDSAGNGYIAANNGSNKIALFKLAPGALAWSKVVDTTQPVTENCRALADDHIGHLILQCDTKMLRSK